MRNTDSEGLNREDVCKNHLSTTIDVTKLYTNDAMTNCTIFFCVSIFSIFCHDEMGTAHYLYERQNNG